MLSKFYIYQCVLFSLLNFVSAVVVQHVNNITIPLNKKITYENKELYGDILNLNESSLLCVNFNNVDPNITFIIFQVHTHLAKVNLYINKFTPSTATSGTNIGLYSNNITTDIFCIQNLNVFPVEAYISINGFWKNDPIPGGCNMEQPVPICPYIISDYNDDYINVDVATPGDRLDVNCLSTIIIKVTFYLMYLPEKDVDPDTYFHGIKQMITLDGILRHGTVVAQTIWPVRRMISAYPGIGSIYVAVAQKPAEDGDIPYAVYVPTHTYACSPKEESCELFDDTLLQFLCASLLFLGLFVCYFGHRFFQTEMFLVGFFSGVIISNIVILYSAHLSASALALASAMSGLCFGAIWLLFWWLFGLPVFAVLLASLNLGFLIASIAYYTLPGSAMFDDIDLNFWSIFILIVLLTSLTLMWMTFNANILCCAVLGGYMTVYPVDNYLGSNLRFILINTIRRATVPGFEHAVLMPPFQWKDFTVTLLWATLAISGFMYQYYSNRNRPPFPPPPRGIRARVEPPTYSQTTLPPSTGISANTSQTTERTPLLISQTNITYS